MSVPQFLALPPTGFEQLSKDQQIDYVQQWDLILAVPEQVPVPEWHIEVVRSRVTSLDAAQLSPWSEVKQRLLSKYREC